ncbi:MAG: XdhC family protein, partial [Candidatus Heimdallarchaeota archaeon]|nr:XdhC family protein [Candidatus Heimdallarchaeota archaeon]
MNENQSWETFLDALEKGNNVVLVVIIDRKGSAPNSPGAKMFVTFNEVSGTVGGGISEHNLLNHARRLLKEGTLTTETLHLEHSETAEENRSGMICSGSQTFALVPLSAPDKSVIKEINEAYDKAKPGVLTINEKGISFEKDKSLVEDRVFSKENEIWLYQENIAKQDKLYIIGGGHVSLALSQVMETLGFHITVYDDRENLQTMNNNIFAHNKQVLSYENIAENIPEGDNIYVTIMTFGHVSDENVLERIISKKCRYIGMMASVKKAETVFSNLEKKGLSKELLDIVHSPIGIKIQSNTPEEIA